MKQKLNLLNLITLIVCLNLSLDIQARHIIDSDFYCEYKAGASGSELENNPCRTIPSKICVEESAYIFTIKLPVISRSYAIYYKLGCRNDDTFNFIFT